MNAIPFPDFFLIGAPRCGTTSMASALAHHPKICFSRPKEPHFFTFFRRHFPQADLERHYLRFCFGHYDPERHERLGEGSVSYLYDREAIGQILRHNPGARFIVMVRNPIDLVHSYHSRLLALLDEEVEEFEEAWRLQELRARGERIPPLCRDPFLLQYREIGRIGTRLKELSELVPREQLLVLLFDDFVRDSRAAYLEVLHFLDLPDDGRTQFKRLAANQYPRFRWLQRLLKRPPKQAASFLMALESQKRRKEKKRSLLKRLRKRLLKWNTLSRPRPPLSPEMRRELAETFREEVALLGELLGRDLSHWLRSGARSDRAPDRAAAA